MEVELIAHRFIELRKSGSKLRPSDYNGITEVLDTGIAREDVLRWMEECFRNYRPGHHRDSSDKSTSLMVVSLIKEEPLGSLNVSQ